MITTYDLIVTLEELLPLFLERREPAVVVVEPLALLDLPVVLDVAARVLPQPLLLLVLVHRRLAKRYVHAHRRLARTRKHRQICPLILVEVVPDCYYHLFYLNAILYL